VAALELRNLARLVVRHDYGVLRAVGTCLLNASFVFWSYLFKPFANVSKALIVELKRLGSKDDTPRVPVALLAVNLNLHFAPPR